MNPPRSSKAWKKVWLFATPVLLLLAILLWKGGRFDGFSESAKEAGNAKGGDKGLSSGDPAGSHAVLRSKVSEREQVLEKLTHSVLQLKDFFIPSIEIDGLTLGAALDKLRTAYEETCRETGEVPLSLAFDIPSGHRELLRLTLAAKNLDASIRFLAAVSGLEVKREGSTYRFSEPAKLAGETRKVLTVPPDLMARFGEYTGGSSGDLREILAAMGVALDPSTSVAFNPARATLEISTASAADLARIEGLNRIQSNQLPVQQKFETKMLELPPGMDWSAPDLSGQYSDGQVQLMMREFAQKSGIDLVGLPAITARSGETATIEMIREYIVPTDDSGKNFESFNLGHVMKLDSSLLGLGQRMTVAYTDTEAVPDPETGKVEIDVKADIKGTSFIGDGSTKLYVHTRPDGSRRVMMTTATRIDATGRPVKETR
ncbi:hypothetical protein [Luteolibacter luteus]|uniref:Uncharacterized protein n=1 Tax=Luteolibacter luteus TaxID=2728835 RepID=A0A858RH54_9BACT|nr:hypothetical protein [Luteolibacter luteus]QJE96207.1 hypothetical protein HHL09_10560 [Luteolibacter luteus]